jgi:hypothetical protein
MGAWLMFIGACFDSQLKRYDSLRVAPISRLFLLRSTAGASSSVEITNSLGVFFSIMTNTFIAGTIRDITNFDFQFEGMTDHEDCNVL